MKLSMQSARIGIAAAVIVGTIGWLAYTGYGANKSYYVKIPELLAMGNVSHTRNLRVDGFVQPGSIKPDGPRVTFVLNEFESHSPKASSGRLLTVVYDGSEPPPDTFKDDSEAVAQGTYHTDGTFYATGLQAKCASKYAPVQPGSPGAAPQPPTGARPATASGAAQPAPLATQAAN
jgi:cytochrome c-type biogenesis protein CcmE